MNGEQSEALIYPDPAFISKTHLSSNGLGALQPVLVRSLDEAIPNEDNEERLLCPIRTLKQYLKRTSQYRCSEQKKLIISHQRGLNKDISSLTVSAYIKELIMAAHREQNPDSVGSLSVKAHSVRKVATSLRSVKNLSMEELLRAGAWTTPGVFLSHYVQSFQPINILKFLG